MARRLNTYLPWSDGIQIAWSTDRVRTALVEHMNGGFLESAQMADAMLGDDRIAATVGTRVNGLLGLPFEVVNDASEREDPASKRVEEGLDDWYPREIEEEMLRWYHLCGFSFAHLTWDKSASEWAPRAEVWHPQHFRFDAESRKWRVQTREAGEIDVDLESGEWILMAKGTRPWANGYVRGLAIPWLSRQFAWRDHNRYNERHGLPIVKGMYPARASDAHRKAFVRGLKRMASESVVELPTGVDADGTGFDLQLLEAVDGSYQTFQDLIEECNSSIAILLLGQNLTTEVSSGSLAAARVQERVRMDYIGSDAREASQAKDRLIEFWARFNLGDGKQRPSAQWNAEPPEDTEGKAATLKTIADGLAMLKTTGVSLTEQSAQELFSEIGLDVEFSEPPEPEPLPPVQPPEPEQTDRTNLSAITLASGDDPGEDRGFVEGQMFMTALADDADRTMARAASDMVSSTIKATDGAEDYSTARQGVVREHEQKSDSEAVMALALSTLMAMGELAGRVAANPEASLASLPAKMARADKARAMLLDGLDLSDEDLAAIDAESKRQARIRAATHRANITQAAADHLDTAEIAGVAIAAALAGLGGALARHKRTETVTVNAAQTGYGRGRWEGLGSDAGRPFGCSMPFSTVARRSSADRATG